MGESFIDFPEKRSASSVPTLKGAIIDSSYSGPLLKCESAAFMGDSYAVSSIVLLVGPRSPLAIARIIVSIAINSFKGIAGRLRSHVFIERSERIAPTVAHRDTSSAISSEADSFRIGASLFGGTPRRIFLAVHHVVFRRTNAGTLRRIASATATRAANQVRCVDGFRLTAFAGTIPARTTVGTVARNNGPVSECETSDIFECSHCGLPPFMVRVAAAFSASLRPADCTPFCR